MSEKHPDFEIQAVNTIQPPDIECTCHDLERISRVPDFFVTFIKHGYYFSGSWTQVLIVINSELHWF